MSEISAMRSASPGWRADEQRRRSSAARSATSVTGSDAPAAERAVSQLDRAVPGRAATGRLRQVRAIQAADSPWNVDRRPTVADQRPAAPAATGMSVRPSSARTRRALRVVAAQPGVAGDGRDREDLQLGPGQGQREASASSWPGSQSRMTGRGGADAAYHGRS